MEDPSDAMDGTDQNTDAVLNSTDSSSAVDDELWATTSTTLVEVVPGAAVVFGDVPEGLELIDFGLISSADRARLSVALGSIGNAAAIGGNLANAVASAQGLYRVSDATFALLNSGGQLAVKDGANLGAIFANGKVVAQARFIPYSLTVAQAAASLGPTIAMIALQMQLSEVSGLVNTNIALTTQTLKTIRHEQWSELAGLTKAIDRAINEASEIGSVTRSLWENVAGSDAALGKQLDLYQRNVNDHIRQLGELHGHERRQYLETNAEAILFDAYALLHSLKAQTEYQALRAARARTEGADDRHEALLGDVIARDARVGFDSALKASARLVEALTRELRIIAELPGRAALPLTEKRRDAKASRLTCAQLLAAVEPLSDTLHPVVGALGAPEVVCAPDDLDVEAYLHILRWFMEDGETLRGLAFPYQSGSHDLLDAVPSVLAQRVDAAWTCLTPGKWAVVLDKVASSTLIAITDRRVITAVPRMFLRRGELSAGFPLSEVRYVRTATKQAGSTRTSIDVTTRDRDVRWIFSAPADDGTIGQLASMLAESMIIPEDERAVIEDLRVPVLDK